MLPLYSPTPRRAYNPVPFMYASDDAHVTVVPLSSTVSAPTMVTYQAGGLVYTPLPSTYDSRIADQVLRIPLSDYRLHATRDMPWATSIEQYLDRQPWHWTDVYRKFPHLRRDTRPSELGIVDYAVIGREHLNKHARDYWEGHIDCKACEAMVQALLSRNFYIIGKFPVSIPPPVEFQAETIACSVANSVVGADSSVTGMGSFESDDPDERGATSTTKSVACSSSDPRLTLIQVISSVY